MRNQEAVSAEVWSRTFLNVGRGGMGIISSALTSKAAYIGSVALMAPTLAKITNGLTPTNDMDDQGGAWSEYIAALDRIKETIPGTDLEGLKLQAIFADKDGINSQKKQAYITQALLETRRKALNRMEEKRTFRGRGDLLQEAADKNKRIYNIYNANSS